MLIGLTLAILVGPIFITLIKISMQYGVKAGMAAVAGIWISDVLVIILAWWGIQKAGNWFQSPAFVYWQGITGGVIITIVGLVSFFSNRRYEADNNDDRKRSFFTFFTRGFLVNFVNPFTFVFWLTVLSAQLIHTNIIPMEIILLFTGILATILITDSLKVLLSKKISTFLTPHHISVFHKIASLILSLIGIFIIMRVV